MKGRDPARPPGLVDPLPGLHLFVRVARTGSFSRAAKEVGLSQPTASRMITQLESQLGVVLLARTTRAVTLTDAGRAYLEQVQRVLDLLEEANASVRDTGELRGVLRVGTASIVASRVLMPRLGRFLAAHPKLRVDLVVDDRRQNLVAEGIDVALRFGRLTESNLVARKLRSWPIVMGASPSYLRAHGTPGSPDDLANHLAILAGPAADGRWRLRDGEREVVVQMRGVVSINASEVAVNAALEGLGIVAATYPSLERHLGDGTLVHLLPGWTLGEIEAHAVYPGGQAIKAAARAFTEFLRMELRLP